MFYLRPLLIYPSLVTTSRSVMISSVVNFPFTQYFALDFVIENDFSPVITRKVHFFTIGAGVCLVFLALKPSS